MRGSGAIAHGGMLHGGASGDGPSLFVASSWALCINAQCAAEPNAGATARHRSPPTSASQAS